MHRWKLETRQLCKTFSNPRTGEDVEVLRDIDLRLPPGQFLSIVGASGCGKTTLLRLIDGLIASSGGSVLIDGRPVSEPGPDRGFVFQSDALLMWRTVVDNIGFGLEAKGMDKKDARSRARELVGLVGLAGFEDYYPQEISGGMRQRVNLARALVIDPEVLLMDEPFASLDSQTREIMQQELLRIWSAQQKTVLFVTHQIDEAVYLSDRVVVLTSRPGRVKEIIDVDIPRPRSLEVKRIPAFTAMVDHIWKLIEQEVIQNVRS